MKLDVIVPDYAGHQIVAGARCLTRHGVRVGRLRPHSRFYPPEGRSIRGVVLNSRRMSMERHARKVEQIVDSTGARLVLPFGLKAHHFMIEGFDDEFRSEYCVLPSREAFRTANNKFEMTERVAAIGLPTPRQALLSDVSGAESFSEQTSYPVVLKIRSGTGVRDGLRIVDTASDLVSAFTELQSKDLGPESDNSAIIAQEYIPGDIHDACTLSFHGEPVEILTQVRRLMSPPEAGVGALNITTDDRVLSDHAAAVLTELGWNGPAQIEFKLDPRDGKYKFIELNPKLWGTLDLSIKSGMDFPQMIWEFRTHGRLQRKRFYRTSTAYHFWFPQLRSAWPFYTPEERREVTISRKENTVFSDLSSGDPLPDLWRRLMWLRGRLQRALR